MALPKKEDVERVNICGHQYVLRPEIARFNRRAAAGEFALFGDWTCRNDSNIQ